jgi:hypothetical protein
MATTESNDRKPQQEQPRPDETKKELTEEQIAAIAGGQRALELGRERLGPR